LYSNQESTSSPRVGRVVCCARLDDDDFFSSALVGGLDKKKEFLKRRDLFFNAKP